MNLRNFFFSGMGIAAVAVPVWGKGPEPYGLTPSARQVEWYNREMIAFFHFGINTFEEYVNEGGTDVLRQLYSILRPSIADSGCVPFSRPVSPVPSLQPNMPMGFAFGPVNIRIME